MQNPYQAPSPVGYEPLPDASAPSVVKLTASQQMRLRELLRKSTHPDQVDEFLVNCGVLRELLESAYQELSLRRSHLLDRYLMKRNVRTIGAVVVLLTAGLTFATPGHIPSVVSLGLLAYGVALMITGSLKLGF